MEIEPNILVIARAAIAEFGANAASAMDKRADDHERCGEREGAELWRQVADAIRRILSA